MPKKKTRFVLAVQAPDKKREYADFVRWYMIPASFRNLVRSELERLGLPEWFVTLCAFRTQGEFAKGFKISPHTLSRWVNMDQFKRDCEVFNNGFIKEFYKAQIDHSFTQKVIKYGDAPRVKLWKELFDGHVTTIKVEQQDEFSELVSQMTTEELREVIALKKKIAERIAKATTK